jgi:hypothetical protein
LRVARHPFDLGRNERLVALPLLEAEAEDAFGIAVGAGGVDEVDAEVERAMQRIDVLRLFSPDRGNCA